jgi:enoyl-CoA hydratase/carnithine racemase
VTYENILLTKKDMVATIEMNRPHKMNALSDGLLLDMQAALDDVEMDRDVRALIITGAGRAFCSGFDLSPREDPFTTVEDWREHVKLGNDTWFKIWHSRLPVVAAVNGYCLGGGCDLSMVCDFTIAAADAQFGEPEIQFHSAPPFSIMPWVLPMKVTKELLLTGNRMDAEKAERVGMVNKVVAPDDLMHEAEEFARQLIKVSPSAMDLNKRTINRGYDIRGFSATIDYGAEMFTLVHMTESEESKRFFAIAAEQGLSAAFKWRDEMFRQIS